MTDDLPTPPFPDEIPSMRVFDRGCMNRLGRPSSWPSAAVGMAVVVVSCVLGPAVDRLPPQQHPKPGPGLLVHDRVAHRHLVDAPHPTDCLADPLLQLVDLGIVRHRECDVHGRPLLRFTRTDPTMPNSPSGRRNSGSTTAATAAVTWDSSMDIQHLLGEIRRHR